MSERGGTALIVGAGAGLSASLARAFSAKGMQVALAARDVEKLAGLCRETGAMPFRCDAAEPAQIEQLFQTLDRELPPLEVAAYNPSRRPRGPLVDLDPGAVRDALMVTAFGAFVTAQQAAKRMLQRGAGAILLAGASAGVKGYARSAPFAMGKFALRGLAQSMARELHPQGIHVVHVVIDGGIGSAGGSQDDRMLDPDAIASTCVHLLEQPRSVWTWEIEVRPWVESF